MWAIDVFDTWRHFATKGGLGYGELDILVIQITPFCLLMRERIEADYSLGYDHGFARISNPLWNEPKLPFVDYSIADHYQAIT
ncbi:hypothetical protein [Nitrosococcus halophilus]|uniref:hypothetical protein n=1 Tax=Nitrosococcus halophilus TaxID=133539 RepID=UPI00059BB6C7|nr:hypothetical protein [Nitrosococcus halophilus]